MAKKASTSSPARPRLLTGGNPQIPKGDGEGPVRAYIDAMPGWKCDVGRRLDTLIVETVPAVRQAVRWNSPFYGIEDRGWFVSFYCFTEYVKLTFLNGASLDPPPPIESKHTDVRYSKIFETDEIDEKQLAAWFRQASELPGEALF
ncbi:MAG: DUF1801 domain-containing protein [Planctomycetota bacterium]